MQKKTTKIPAQDKLLDLLNRQGRPRRLDALARAAGVKDKKGFAQALEGLAAAGLAARLPGGLWMPLNGQPAETAEFRQLPSGNCVAILADGSEVAIRPANAGDAWDRDQVKIQILPGNGEAKVAGILKRTQNSVAARVEKREGKTLVCRSAGKGAPIEFHMRYDAAKFADKKPSHGLLVGVRPEKRLAPGLWQATLVDIYPNENAVATQEAVVKNAHGVPGAFPKKALAQAAALPEAPGPGDIGGREDLRHIPFVTIDGADARDFDDAIHVEKTDKGWLLRVAIADVSHYVEPDAAPESLDGEARRRGNSWYFPRSVEPMLPFALSNGLCSLKPHEDRLAMLAEIAIDKKGSPMSARFAPIVMRSKARLTYDQAARFFAAPGESDVSSPEIRAMLNDALGLYKALAKMRHERGTLDFELPEPAYDFNADGTLAGIRKAERNDAHRLIEEFMIAANEAVARHLGKAKLPFPYRVHPRPEQAKLEGLFEALRLAAPETLPAGATAESLGEPKTIQKILEAAQGKPCEFVVNRLCLRSMSQAKYLPENLGHFGLASKDYCHFTSPIRRYADLLTHRALKASLGLARMESLAGGGELEQISADLNKLEREALECERDMARRLGCMALKDRVGQTLPGSVSGVTEFGLFVEFKDMPAEGLIRISELSNDWYEFDQRSQMLIGRNTGQTWRLGQPVDARILDVDLDRFETRLAPAQLPGRKQPKKERGKGSSFEKSRPRQGKGKIRAETRRGSKAGRGMTR